MTTNRKDCILTPGRFKVSVTQEHTKHPKGAFDRFGGNTTVSYMPANDPELYNTFRKLSTTAADLWWGLVIVYDRRTGIGVFVPEGRKEENRTYLGYKELRNKELIIRVRPHHYLLNPFKLYPLDYDAGCDLWNKLTQKGDDDGLR